LKPWQDGDAWLAGGTWLFSQQQPRLRRLVDLSGLGWEPLQVSERGLQIAATCTIAQLDAAALPQTWLAKPLLGQCCRSLLASFKIWNTATVGGNICLALPAGPMTSLAAALDGVGTIWMADGTDRQIRISDLVTGPGTTSLMPGDILRHIDLPASALQRRTAFRQISQSRHGRSSALLIGTRPAQGNGFTLTVTASTRRPFQLHFDDIPAADELRAAITKDIPAASYFDDQHGQPDWRQHVTLYLAENIRRELATRAAP
jgi:CO/xanthine dehydrogenase FAD-binding subunit